MMQPSHSNDESPITEAQPPPALTYLLKFWIGRAVLIALPSLILALIFGFNTAPCVAGMALGIVLWIGIYVVCAALLQGGVLRNRPHSVRILNTILIVRTSIAWLFYLELLSGLLSSFLVEAFFRWKTLGAKSPGFVSAFLMTMTQGALITLSLVLITGVVFGVRALMKLRASGKRSD